MIESYAFLAMFAVQILVLSVVHPGLLIKFLCATDTEYSDAIFAKLHPGVDQHLKRERLCARYRDVNTAIAVLGVFALGWMFGNMQRTGTIKVDVFDPVFYFLLQISPLLGLILIGLKRLKEIRPLLMERKRKAVLQRRDRFDFVSPVRVSLDYSIGLLTVALVLYLMYFARDPMSQFVGYAVLGAIALGYVVDYFTWDWTLYGRKLPLETNIERIRWTGQLASRSIYWSISSAVFFWLFLLLPRLGLQSWLPFTASAAVVYVALLMCDLDAPSRKPEVDVHSEESSAH